jgi:hypothetical protein
MLNTAHRSVDETAAHIVALINSSPRSPRQDQIAAIIAAQTALPPDGSILSPKRDAWRALIAEHDAAHLVSGDLLPGDPLDPRIAAAEAITKVADDRLNAFEEELWAAPAQGRADIRLLAEICFRRYWPGYDLTGAESDSLLREGPHVCDGEDLDKALGALLRAIRDAVPASALPRSTPSPALLSWCDTVNAYLVANEHLGEGDEAERLSDEFCAATERIWAKPVGTFDDLVVRTAVAVHWNSPGMLDDTAYPENILADGPDNSLDDRALAFVVRGILDLAGLSSCFDADGRLLGIHTPAPF